ncbi:hypothetical protein KSF78_0005794 [Schistosoma japonicum]|nr:hypothetical protein KSF78_0005794 [Schistosoma japonicum]
MRQMSIVLQIFTTFIIIVLVNMLIVKE